MIRASAGALCLGFVLCSCGPAALEPDPGDIQIARRAALTYDLRLHQEILDRLEREPPATVLRLYRNRAQAMAEEVSDEFGVELRRTAFRVRNRTNVADDWEYEKLEALEFSIEAGLDPALLEFTEIVRDNSGQAQFRWIRPLSMTQECLVCHGEQIPVAVLDILAVDYPDDEATGYFEYALSGAYSVTRRIE